MLENACGGSSSAAGSDGSVTLRDSCPAGLGWAYQRNGPLSTENHMVSSLIPASRARAGQDDGVLCSILGKNLKSIADLRPAC